MSGSPRRRKVARAARSVRDGFMRWLTKPLTLGEGIAMAIRWVLILVIYQVAKNA